MADQPLEYDAFLSYAHRDRQVATAIQKGLHQIGRRFGQLRALRVFRDDTNLAASPDLWGKIVEALDRSGHMIVVLSPQSATSHWVNEEIGHWIGHRGDDKLMLVLAEGRLQWDPAGKRFDPAGSDAAPPALTQPGSLQSEPLYIDVSDDSPWDLRALTFRDKVTALAAPVHGKPKDQLAGDDLREQRRFRRLRAAAVAGLALLTVIAVVAAGVAFAQRQEAVRRLHDAVTAKLNSEGAAMLAGLTPGGDERGMQELLAANAIQSNGVPILNAQIARFATRKIIDTGSAVKELAYSPDGRRIATAQANGAVRQWDSATGKAFGPHIAGHTDVASSVAYTPDGRTIASTGADNALRLWNADTGAALNPKPAHTDFPETLAVSPDGRLIVTGGDADRIQLWDAHTGQLLKSEQVMDNSTGSVDDVLFDRSGRWFAALAHDKLAIYDTDTFTLRGPLIDATTDGAAGFHIALSPDGHTIAVGGASLRLLDTDTGKEIRTIALGASRAGSYATAVTFSPDGDRIATGRFDGAVQLWDAHTGGQIGPTLTGQTGESTAIAFSPDGRQLATTSIEGTLRIWNIKVGLPMSGPEPLLTKVAVSPDGRRIVALAATVVEQWDIATGEALPTVPVGRDEGGARAFAVLDGGRIVTAASDGTLQTWNLDNGQPLQPPVHIDGVTDDRRVVFSPDGHTVAVADDEHSVAQLWSGITGRSLGPPMAVHNPVNALETMQFSPDGRRVAIGYLDGVRVWNTQTSQLEQTVKTYSKTLNPVAALAFSRDGAALAVAGANGSIQLWDSTTLKPLPHSPLPHQTGFANGLAFGPGHELASGGTDANLRLWDAATGTPTAAPLATPDTVMDVALSPDGRLAASAVLNGTILLSPAIADAAQLCDKLPANMSRKQWRDWVSPGIDYIQVCPGLPIAPD